MVLQRDLRCKEQRLDLFHSENRIVCTLNQQSKLTSPATKQLKHAVTEVDVQSQLNITQALLRPGSN